VSTRDGSDSDTTPNKMTRHMPVVIQQDAGSFSILKYVITVDFVKLKMSSRYPQYSSNTQNVLSNMKGQQQDSSKRKDLPTYD
jgi:hypothetical protein